MKKVVYTYKALGDSMALLREVSGIPVKELCEGCGISNRTYYQVIFGETLALAITSGSFIICVKMRMKSVIVNAAMPWKNTCWMYGSDEILS